MCVLGLMGLPYDPRVCVCVFPGGGFFMWQQRQGHILSVCLVWALTHITAFHWASEHLPECLHVPYLSFPSGCQSVS